MVQIYFISFTVKRIKLCSWMIEAHIYVLNASYILLTDIVGLRPL
jgi:hypothetical protein